MGANDPVNGTVAPPTATFPQWLLDWEADKSTSEIHITVSGQIPPSYGKITLHNFIFLGKDFEESSYAGFSSPFTEDAKPVTDPIKGTGVCAELKAFLVEAQHLAWSLFVMERRAQNRTDIGKDDFAAWCGVVGQHKGFQVRDGKHKLGAAIDIDPLSNPYVATADEARTGFGGEKPKGADSKALGEAVYRPAVTGYDHAIGFTFGSSAPRAGVFGRKSGETSREIFRRFERVSYALRVYMDVGFAEDRRSLPVATDIRPRDVGEDPTPDTMSATLKRYDGVGSRVSPPTLARHRDIPFLTAMRTEVSQDMEAVRRAMINGRWTFKDGAQKGVTATRNPRFGIMSLREGVVVSLLDARVNEQRLRWGAIDFGTDENGDVMHFDVGDTITKAIKDNARVEPNPQSIFFGIPSPREKKK